MSGNVKALCPSCPHPVRQHGDDGCERDECLCDLAHGKRGMKPTFRWEDPPANDQAARVNQEYLEIAAKLREQPGQWARIFDAATSGFHSSISNGRLIAFRPKGAFQARSKRNPDGTRIVWVRYVGTGPES